MAAFSIDRVAAERNEGVKLTFYGVNDECRLAIVANDKCSIFVLIVRYHEVR